MGKSLKLSDSESRTYVAVISKDANEWLHIKFTSFEMAKWFVDNVVEQGYIYGRIHRITTKTVIDSKIVYKGAAKGNQ